MVVTDRGRGTWLRTVSTARVREATLADSAALATLMSWLGYETTSAQMEARLRATRVLPEYVAFVAESDDRVIGMAGAMLAHFYEKDGRCARLLTLVVAPEHRGAAVGARLVREVEGWAKANEASEVVVNSGDQRIAAHRFYERLGYHGTGRRFVKTLSGASEAS